MRNSMKKISWILCLTVFLLAVVFLLPARANAATYGDLTYQISNGKVTITDCNTSASGELVILDTIEGYPVTSIGNYAFYYCSSLTSITIPEGVTSIGDSAFRECSSLTSITLPEGVTSIDQSAFSACSSLTSITIPDGVTIIGDHAFSSCGSLISIILPEGVISIGYAAFYNCSSLTSITIPEGVTSIGDSAFSRCSSLTSITIPEGVTSIGNSTFWGCSSLTNITIPEGVTSIGDYAFNGCSSLTSITLPEGVASIGDYAFNDCSSLTSITLPAGVTNIGDAAFSLCINLTSITIPNSVASIGDAAFNSCISLTNITIPEGVTSIGDSAFYYCTSLTSITIPEGVTSIGDSTFCSCASLTSITIPEGVTSIDYAAFAQCGSLTSITIPDGVTIIGDYAFSSCGSLISIIIPDSVTSIGDGTFFNCASLTSITIPDGITSIGYQMFYFCDSLTSITIPADVTNIGDAAFHYCYSLTSVTIPDSVTSIGYEAFYYCSGLNHVSYTGTAEQWDAIAIESGNSSLTDADVFHYETEAPYQHKNCVNRGLFCASCNDFLTREKAEDGSHSYTDHTDISCNDCEYIRTVKSIAIYHVPDVTEYALFEGKLDVTNGILTVTYSDGSVGKVEMTADMISGFDNALIGAQQLTVTYGGAVTSYTVEIVAGNPATLVLDTLPDKCSYLIGGRIDLTGISLTARYPNDQSVTLGAEDVTADALDMTTPGVKTVTVRFKESFVTYEIFVHEKLSQIVDSSLYPESSHNYAGNTDETKTLNVDGSEELVLTFSAESYTESNYDFVYILDGAGNEIGKYSGNLSGKVVTVPGDTVQIRLTSDSSVNKYGYAFSSITAEAICHPEKTVFGYAPTCTQTGLTDGTICQYCEKILTLQEEIPALGHSEIIDAAVDPSCTETGLTEGKHCDRCNEVLSAQEEVAALGHVEVIDAAVDASCTETGLTEGKHCERCGEILIQQEEVPMLAHEYGQWVTTQTPSFSAEGQRQQACVHCGDTISEVIPVAVGKVEKWNITLQDALLVNLHLNISEAIESTAKVKVTVGDNILNLRVKDLEKTAEGLYVVSVELAAAQMAEDIVVFVIDKNIVGSYSNYTVRQYADAVLANDSFSQYHDLVKEMLSYGAAAQAYFDYCADTLADEGITGAGQIEIPETADQEMAVSGAVEGVNFYAATLSYRDRIAVRFYFKFTGDINTCTFTVDGETLIPGLKNGLFYVDVPDILPENLDQQVILHVTDADGNVLTVNYGPMNYIVRMNEKGSDSLKALLKALYNYHLAAKALRAA